MEKMARLLKQRQMERAELEAEISAQRGDPVSKNIQKLIDALIQEAREENDSAPVRSIIRNQGKIAALRQLKGIIQDDLPTFKPEE